MKWRKAKKVSLIGCDKKVYLIVIDIENLLKTERCI